MNILNIIKDVIQPAADLVDNLHTSEEEKLAAKGALLQVQVDFLTKGLAYEEEQLKARSRIIEAEANSGNWLTSSWRPVTMYAFLAMLMTWWWGWTELPPNVTEEVLQEVFGLLKIGIGGYIGSRGVEKVVPPIMKALKSRDET